MIAFCCPACQKKVSARDEQAGKKARCPGCGRAVSIPAPTTEGAPLRAEDRPVQATVPYEARILPPSDVNGTQGGALPDPSLTDFLAPSQSDDELGRLGKYRVLKVLGHGGMGIVFLAEDPKLNRNVAIKAMLPALAASASAGKRFLREAQAMAAVKHDHIVTIFQVDEERGVPFLVMELLQGESLDDRLKRESKLPPAEVLRIGREIAEGLQAAHETGLIHRDVKGANLWLEAPRGRVKILDFGLARAASQEGVLTQEGAIVGTPAFMSPEQARGEPMDARSDLFSLGCVLYRVAAGKTPFKGKDAISTLLAVVNEQPRPLAEIDPDMPESVSELVMALLAKKPADRPASAKAVVEVIAGIEGGASPRTSGHRSPQPKQEEGKRVVSSAGRGLLSARNRYVLTGAAVAVVLAVLVVTLRIRKELLVANVPEAGMSMLVDEEERAANDTKKVGLVDMAWRRHVASLSAVKQADAVAAKLKECNPGFDGKVEPVIEGGKVTELRFLADRVTDVSPVRALTGLRRLDCRGSWGVKAQLADLTPLGGMELTHLICSNTKIVDLTPLKGMKLTDLDLGSGKVTDLAPLKGMPLTSLDVGYTAISSLTPLADMPLTKLVCRVTNIADLTPLRNMKLTMLDCWASRGIADLTPLKGMPLTYLACAETSVTDLSPLKEMPLKELQCDFKPERDAAILRSIKTLEKINEKPVKEFWKEVDAKKP
jgi:hypothetical protein